MGVNDLHKTFIDRPNHKKKNKRNLAELHSTIGIDVSALSCNRVCIIALCALISGPLPIDHGSTAKSEQQRYCELCDFDTVLMRPLFQMKLWYHTRRMTNA
eukprot:scaffold326492_cov159-Cyclotella_meneghiniana.AAC.1